MEAAGECRLEDRYGHVRSNAAAQDRVSHGVGTDIVEDTKIIGSWLKRLIHAQAKMRPTSLLPERGIVAAGPVQRVPTARHSASWSMLRG